MRLLSLCLAVASAAVIATASAGQAYIAIEQRLDAEQLHATGLDTLSPAQLALLNRLLNDEQRAVVAEATAAAAPVDNTGLHEKRAAPQKFSATVQGDVRDLDKGDVLLLDNGQRWRVIDGNLFLRKTASNPKVTVAPGLLGSWYLQIDGESARLKVQRVP